MKRLFPAAAAALLGLLGLLCAGFPRALTLDPFAYYYLDVHDPFFVRREDARGRSYFQTRDPVGRPSQSFAAEKPTETYRAFLVGGSVAQTYDMGESTPTLREALQSLLQGRRVEIIRCGMTGYDSARENLVVEEIAGYEPDLVVVFSGVNESTRPMLSRRAARRCRKPRWRAACERWVQATMAWRARGPKAPELRDKFSENLLRMLGRLRRSGAAVALCTLPVSLRHMPPQGSLPLHEPSFFAGWLEFEAGRWREAARRLETYVERNSGDAMGWYYLARALDLSGRTGEARDLYVRAQNSHRPIPLMNEVLRRTAREEGAILVDLERVFAELSPEGIPGRELLEDDVHWARQRDPLVTSSIAVALRAAARAGAPGLPAASEWDFGWIEKNEAGIRARARAPRGKDDRAWTAFRNHMWEPLAREGGAFSERLLALMETVAGVEPAWLSEPDRLREWLKVGAGGNLWGDDSPERLGRWWPAFLGHAGEFHRRRGDARRAAVFFDAALRLNPGSARLLLRRALAELDLGRRAEAARDLEAARKGGDARLGRELALWREARAP